MGDKVRIKVIAANLDKRQLDYEWVLTLQREPEEVSADEKPAKPKQKKKKGHEE